MTADPAPTTGDAFGEALRAHHEDSHSYLIIERDDGLIRPAAPGEMYFRTPEQWSDRETEAIDRAEGRVLDVGCGAGRHALALQERGHDVTAIDVSDGAIEVARERGVEDARVVDVADVAEELDATYDTVCMLGNNFGLVGTAERAPAILDGLAAVAADDGQLLAESSTPPETGRAVQRDYYERNREQGRLPGAARQRIRFEDLATPWHDYLHAAPETMDDLVTDTPWCLDDVIEGERRDYVGQLTK